MSEITHLIIWNNSNPNTLQELNEAIVNGNSRAVKRALNHACPLREQSDAAAGVNQTAPSALYCAVLFMPELAEEEQLQLFEEEKNHKSGIKNKALYLAGTHEKRIKIFKLLCKKLLENAIAVDDYYDAEGLTAAHLAIRKNNPHVLQILLKQCNPNLPSQTGIPLVHYVVEHAVEECVQTLLSHQLTNLKARNNEGLTPLLLAAQVGNGDIFQNGYLMKIKY